MAMKTKIALDRTSDKHHDNGDRTRTYVVMNAADNTIVGYVNEHWHSAAFVDGNVDMSLYKNSVSEGRRSFTAKLKNGKKIAAGTTRANTVKNVRDGIAAQ